ncbi:MAG: hypothetical protein FJ388_22330, partial [Verrucomicrobia bacterium]|nr:hypothetical protein [Verrucomicrobiota bacterium]
MKSFSRLLLAGVLAAVVVAPTFAFNPPRDTQGPLTVEIANPGDVTALEKSIEVPVTLANAGDSPLSGTVRMSVTDDWRVEGKAAREFTLPPKSRETVPFSVVAGKGTYAALYPVHAHVEFRAGKAPARTAHAILILSVAREALTTAQPRPTTLQAMTAPRLGPLRLDAPKSFQVSIAVHDRPLIVKPPGWSGSDLETGCHATVFDADRGGVRRAISVHPPYRTGWGDELMDWRVALPKTKPIALEFATAIRDQGPREPASDGVEFRVLVSDGGGFKQLFSRFSAAKSWEGGHVDLSDYAGREITLRLFTGPGPKHNTTCDSAFWAEPTLWIGPRPQAEAEADRTARREAAVKAAHAALKGEK